MRWAEIGNSSRMLVLTTGVRMSMGVLACSESITLSTLSAIERPLKPAKPNEAAESRT